MTDLHKADQQALEALFALRALFRDDALACSYQTLGQCRTALLQAMDCAAMAQEPAEQQEPCEPLEVLKRALEIIAVGDSKNPRQDAADALVAIGFWSGEAPQLQPKAEPKGGGRLPPPLQAEPVQEPVDFVSLLREADEIVRGKPTWKRFIDGTPLSNDIAVWMTVFAQDVARRAAPPQRKPLSLTDLQEALVLTNLIGRDAIDDSEEYDEGSTLAQIDELYRIIIKDQA